MTLEEAKSLQEGDEIICVETIGILEGGAIYHFASVGWSFLNTLETGDADYSIKRFELPKNYKPPKKKISDII